MSQVRTHSTQNKTWTLTRPQTVRESSSQRWRRKQKRAMGHDKLLAGSSVLTNHFWSTLQVFGKEHTLLGCVAAPFMVIINRGKSFWVMTPSFNRPRPWLSEWLSVWLSGFLQLHKRKTQLLLANSFILLCLVRWKCHWGLNLTDLSAFIHTVLYFLCCVLVWGSFCDIFQIKSWFVLPETDSHFISQSAGSGSAEFLSPLPPHACSEWGIKSERTFEVIFWFL